MFNFQLTPVVKNLLLITIGIHVIGYFAETQAGFSISDVMALYPYASENFQPYQLITSMFAHADVGHLFHNMLGLFFFGPVLEQVLGSKRFMTMYLICGIGSTLLFSGVNTWEIQQLQEARQEYVAEPSPEKLHFFITKEMGGYERFQAPSQAYDFVNITYAENPSSQEYIQSGLSIVNNHVSDWATNSSVRGASGAIFGILMAFMLIFPNREIYLLFPPIPIKAKYLVSAYAAYEAYNLIANVPNDNVAHLAHLGGMLFAFILIRYWKIPQMM